MVGTEHGVRGRYGGERARDFLGNSSSGRRNREHVVAKPVKSFSDARLLTVGASYETKNHQLRADDCAFCFVSVDPPNELVDKDISAY